jgi:hypothetical protein
VKTLSQTMFANAGAAPRPLGQQGEAPVCHDAPAARAAAADPPADELVADDLVADGLRTALLRRLWLNADHQVGEIERRLADAPSAAPPEREARTLAVLARIVRELSAAEAVADATRTRRERARAEAARRREADDDGQPRTLDQLRDDLARRLEQLRRARTAGGAAGDLPRG